MTDFLSRSVTPLLLPLLLIQGVWVRLRTPRLPVACGPFSGTISGEGDPLSLMVLGESPVAGIGATTHEFALTGRTASSLARRTQRSVRWQVFGLSGATAKQSLLELVPQMAGKNADAVIIALGVNDVISWRGVSQWTRDIEHLIAGVRQRVGDSVIILTGVPPMQYFPALPQPLKHVLGLRARLLDRGSAKLATMLPRVIHVPSNFELDRGFFCTDGFHPSERGYAEWGDLLAEVMLTYL
jgi:lysophospholipase L1-like esterase